MLAAKAADLPKRPRGLQHRAREKRCHSREVVTAGRWRSNRRSGQSTNSSPRVQCDSGCSPPSSIKSYQFTIIELLGISTNHYSNGIYQVMSRHFPGSTHTSSSHLPPIVLPQPVGSRSPCWHMVRQNELLADTLSLITIMVSLRTSS